MKKILLINQHTCNHGDESAGMALIRKIKQNNVDVTIDILYNWYFKLSPEAHIGNGMDDLKGINHYHYPIGKVDKLIIRLIILMPFLSALFLLFSSTLKKQYQLIKSYDFIVSAPGGINLGPYQDWYYLWRLFMAKRMNKELAIYSISFGPLDGLPKIFQKRAIEVLKHAKFLSLRDDKSHGFADTLGLRYNKAIDTTYLVKKSVEIPEVYNELKSKEYVVVVPNELYRWHTYFKTINKRDMDDLYISIIKHIINKEDLDVVLLPQMFADENDQNYMTRLSKEVNSKRLTIIDDHYNSDLQQEIIANSQFVIGARYHTIVFSINNNIPFYALSYEHKIENMLSILELKDFNLDLLSYFKSKKDINEVLQDISNSLRSRKDNQQKVDKGNTKAMEIVNTTYLEFEKELKQI
ncbi:polysaccharide pyruvyl transferase family protein [Aquimarina sp. 2201CG14-23]|uniref:polysaccharide pyruvyl transferase family protein n=1 Tax=Aquimarina mycalae TaxID=3040073 RepID=UPI00247819AB|nr:polysaccharide pyruvyl transferase family protein [Aquimarina sp. 2201CG14-23]MDH7446364.1 polysaccharide pyruvyl transferase family protein [Aquimarina sp. 2201CG14-23]